MVEANRVDRARELARTAWELFPDHGDIQRWHTILGSPKIKRIPLRGAKRTEEANWLRENADDYRGKWVVLFGSKLVGFGDRWRKVIEMARREGDVSDMLVHQIPNK